MKLISPKEYIAQAANDVTKAQRRVALIAMVIADHPATHPLIVAIEAAAARGIDARVSADVFTYGEVSGSFLPVKYYSPNARLATKMARTLRRAGVRFDWLGRARLTLFNGRTHSKWCVVDDTVYAFGGVNIHEEGVHNADYMFRVEDAALADRLIDEQDRIAKAERRSGNYPSVVHEFPDKTVYFDGGVVGQSAIYRRVCELTRDAEEVLYVSQYCPTGRLARELRKKNTRLYFNRPEQADFLNKALIKFSILTSGLRTHYKKKRYLHAKFMIFTMPGGTRIAITGSHNFAYTGVLFGTREVALETKDEKIIRQLEAFFETKVA
jgi:cardiolipin synthase